MADGDDFNGTVISEFRANDGKVGGFFEGQPLLLLHHAGAKTGPGGGRGRARRDLGHAEGTHAPFRGL